MKQIVWRAGKYKYRDSAIGFINHVQVAVVTPLHDGSKFDAKLLLPGAPKGTNSFGNLEGAKSSLEDRINSWFDLVAQ